MTKDSKTSEFILNYLRGRSWTSPTQIGNAHAAHQHSAWASPKCTRLVEQGLLLRNHRGWYILKDSGNTSTNKRKVANR